MPEYIYLLQEREFINSGKSIYKIGKSKQNNLKRFSSYPKGSILLHQSMCPNCDTCERQILEKFKKTFDNKKDIGLEYFEGNPEDMIKIINEEIEIQKNDFSFDIDDMLGGGDKSPNEVKNKPVVSFLSLGCIMENLKYTYAVEDQYLREIYISIWKNIIKDKIATNPILYDSFSKRKEIFEENPTSSYYKP